MLLPLLLAVPAPAAVKPKAAAPAAAHLQAQLKKVIEERDDLKRRLAATESLQEELAASQKSREMARQETQAIRKELDQMKSALAENQGSADTILTELQKAKRETASAKAALEALRKESAASKEKLTAPAAEGTLVVVTPEITPATPMNLSRITPKTRRVSGVVVVNVLVSESGDVLDARLLQGLPGDNKYVVAANAACVEAAKRIVFDPARAADGKTRVRVWQGVGFFLE